MTHTQSIRRVFAALSWFAVAALVVSLAWWLVAYWSGQPESLDRVLFIPAAAGWLLVRSRDALRNLPRRPAAVGLLLVAPATVLVPAAWYLYALVGPMPLLLWWLALVGLAATVGLVLVQYGPKQVRVVAFPLLFLLFALPLPDSAQGGLQGRLQAITTSAVSKMLPVLGVPVQQKGNILSLPSGDLGVVEACSGVRGVTAIVAVAALVANLRGFGVVRGVVLTVFALPVIAVANIVRVLLSALLQEWLGPWVNIGWPHEALGVVTLLVGLAGVLGVSQLLRTKKPNPPAPFPKREGGEDSKDTLEVSPPSRFGKGAGGLGSSSSRFGKGAGGLGSSLAALFLSVAVVGSVVAVWSAWRVRPGAEPAAPVADIPLRFGPWSGVDEPVEDGLRTYLACDTAVHRVYRDPAGQQVQYWVLYWSAASAVKDYIHHPDVCMPNQGWTPTGQERRAVRLEDGTSLEMTVRRFKRDGRRQQIAYWAQDGSRVWTAEEEERAHTSWPTQRWVLDRLLTRQPLERTPRLVVLVAADVWDEEYADRAVESFARQLAAELYRLCPWARPAD